MDNHLFDDLVSSIKKAGAIKRKEIHASRIDGVVNEAFVLNTLLSCCDVNED